MQIIEKGHNTLTTVDIKTKLIEKRHIFIDGEINTELAESVKQQIMYLSESGKDPIYIHINSCGGSIVAGLLVYDIIQTYKERIFTICTGQAYSMAAVLVASAQEGHRYILPNSEMMIHEPLLSNKIGGNCSSIMATSQRLNEVKEKIDGILSKHTGKTIKQINKATSHDNFFSAEDAIAFGLCDRIIDFNEIMR